MTDVTSAKSARRPHHWRRDLIELAALFTAVAVADAIANLIGHQPDGPYLLVASAVALTATATFHTWWARRHSHAPPPTADGLGADHDSSEDRSTHRLTSATRTGTTTGAVAPVTAPAAAGPALSAGETVLWRMRTTVRDTPGSLAALCIALARHRVDILTLQTHPLAEGTVDEFLLRAPSMLQAQQLSRAISAAGGSSTWIERADAHDLVDAPTRILGLATRTALDAAELPSPCVSCSAAAPSTRSLPCRSVAAPPARPRRSRGCWRRP